MFSWLFKRKKVTIPDSLFLYEDDFQFRTSKSKSKYVYSEYEIIDKNAKNIIKYAMKHGLRWSFDVEMIYNEQNDQWYRLSYGKLNVYE